MSPRWRCHDTLPPDECRTPSVVLCQSLEDCVSSVLAVEPMDWFKGKSKPDTMDFPWNFPIDTALSCRVFPSTNPLIEPSHGLTMFDTSCPVMEPRQGIERLIPHAEAECVELMQKLLRHGGAEQKWVCLKMYLTKTSFFQLLNYYTTIVLGCDVWGLLYDSLRYHM